MRTGGCLDMEKLGKILRGKIVGTKDERGMDNCIYKRGQGLNATLTQYCRERIKLASGWFRFADKVGNFSQRMDGRKLFESQGRIGWLRSGELTADEFGQFYY